MMTSFPPPINNSELTRLYFKVEKKTVRKGFLWLQKKEVPVLVLYAQDARGAVRRVDEAGKGIRIIEQKGSKTRGLNLLEKLRGKRHSTSELEIDEWNNTDETRVTYQVSTSSLNNFRKRVSKAVEKVLKELPDYMVPPENHNTPFVTQFEARSEKSSPQIPPPKIRNENILHEAVEYASKAHYIYTAVQEAKAPRGEEETREITQDEKQAILTHAKELRYCWQWEPLNYTAHSSPTARPKNRPSREHKFATKRTPHMERNRQDSSLSTDTDEGIFSMGSTVSSTQPITDEEYIKQYFKHHDPHGNRNQNIRRYHAEQRDLRRRRARRRFGLEAKER